VARDTPIAGASSHSRKAVARDAMMGGVFDIALETALLCSRGSCSRSSKSDSFFLSMESRRGPGPRQVGMMAAVV
jgi:hypothetical protein